MNQHCRQFPRTATPATTLMMPASWLLRLLLVVVIGLFTLSPTRLPEVWHDVTAIDVRNITMLKTKFDPRKRLRFVRYARMSSDQQNPRSPTQQFNTIEATRERLGLDWQHVGDYQDDGISGRYLRQRAGFMRMLEDIFSNRVQVAVILVDTFERIGRLDEVGPIERDLLRKHGVMILTADSFFANPSSPAGRALRFVDTVRSTEENRIKAHQVLRGKIDTAKLCHWPGGSPPFGYALKCFYKEENGRQEFDYSILVPCPDTNWIVELMFETAKQTGWGGCSLAKFLTSHEKLPNDYKPFNGFTLLKQLRNTIYCGTLTWAENCTGIVDDRRVIQPNETEDIVVVENYCEPLVPKKRFDEVNGQIDARAAVRAQKSTDKNGAHIPGRGIALAYLLSGLVRCGECNRAMTVSSSATYVTKSGDARTYPGYVCPGAASGLCPNRTRVSEPWLREMVVELLLNRLGFGD